jgi:hypothetical protein
MNAAMAVASPVFRLVPAILKIRKGGGRKLLKLFPLSGKRKGMTSQGLGQRRTTDGKAPCIIWNKKDTLYF